MNSWDRLGLASTNPPTIAELASDAFGIDVSKFLQNESELKDALVSECIRAGLYSLFSEQDEEPVFHLSLRNWVLRKLRSIMPALFMPEQSDYRGSNYQDILKNLESLGDIIELSGGYLMPRTKPTCVQTGPKSYILVSGHPTRVFQTLGDKVKITRYGRKIEDANDGELARLGIVFQPINSYLEIPDVETPQEVISRILSTSHQQVPVSSIWEIYCDRREGYRFYWIPYDVHRTDLGMVIDYEGMKLSLLREPIGQNYWYYWLQVVSGSDKWFHTVASKDWKWIDWRWVCLALDHLSGRPREAIIVFSESAPVFRLLIDFFPFGALFRWLLAVGGRLIERKSGRVEWELPVSGLEQTRKLLESLGASVRLVEGGGVV